jgi:uncharacterized iron-regulated membrane protein
VAWIRLIHEGSHRGPLWAAIVFLTGIFPAIFAVTGIMIWLCKRSDRGPEMPDVPRRNYAPLSEPSVLVWLRPKGSNAQ